MCRYKRGILATIFFIILIAIVFRKFFLHGLLPIPYNILVGWYFPYNLGGWDAYTPGIFFKGGLFAADVFRQMIPWKQLSLELVRQGQLPLWNPHNFSGEPLLANPQITLFYPLTPLFLLFSNFDIAWSWYIIASPLLGLIFMYLFLRSLKLSTTASVLGSMAFIFSGHMVSWLEWGVVTHSAIWLPLMLYSLNSWLHHHKSWGRGLLIFSTFATFTGGYPQESALSFLIALFYFIFLVLPHRNKRRIITQTALLFVAFVLLISPQAIPTFKHYQNSALKGASSKTLYLKTRLHPRHLLTFFSPDFYGNRITKNYWADQFTTVDYTDANLFIGSVAGFFVLYFLFIKSQNKTAAFFKWLSLASITLALQSPLTWFLAQLQIPLISTGVAAGVLFIAVFSLSVIAAFGFDQWSKTKKLYPATIPIFLFALIITSTLILPADFRRIAIRNLAIPTATTIATFSLLLAHRLNPKSYRRATLLAIILIAATQHGLYTHKTLSFSKPQYSYPSHPLLEQLSRVQGYNRSTGFWDSKIATNLQTQFRHYSAEGYNPLYSRTYAQLFSSAPTGSLPVILTRSDADFPQDNQLNRNRLLDLTSTKFISAKVTDPKNTWEQEPLKYHPDRFQLIWQDGIFKLYQNRLALPRVKLFNHIDVIPNTTDRIQHLFNPQWNPHHSLILEEQPHQLPQESATGSAKITFYSPNQVDISSSSTGNMLLLLTDTYYNSKLNGPWRAYIDGTQTPIYRANHTFRAIVVPQGNHTIKFKITWP